MSANLMDLVASLKLNTQEFMSGLAGAKTGLDDFKGDAASAAAGGEVFGTQLLSLGSALQDLGRNAAIGGAALTASLTLPIAGVVTEALRMSSTFEQAGIALTTMMKSGVDAKVFLEELKNFAASTPFQFNDILQASQRLQALGFEATTVIPIMTAVGNAVAGLGGGEEKINRITLALGQMQAKGKVSAEEMNQLAEAGIGAWQAVADQLGITVPQAMDRAKRGMISATEAIPAILEGMMKQTGGLMEAQMTTLAGQWSNFKDRLDFLFADLGRALTPFANAVMQLAQPLLDMLQGAVDWFGRLSPAVQTGIVALTGLAAAAGPLLVAFGGIATVLGGVASALGVAGIAGLLPLLTPIIVGVTAAMVAMVAAWELLRFEPVQNAVQALGQAMSGFWNETLKPLVESVVAAGVAFAEFAAGVIGSGLSAAWEGLQSVGASLWEGVVALGQALSPLGEAFVAVLDALSPLLSPIGKLVVTIAELVAGIVGAGLITAWEALKIVWNAVLPSVRDLATLLGGALLIAIRGVSEVADFLASTFRDYLKPALEVVAEKVRSFIEAFAALPGVKQIIEGVANAINTMKTVVGGAIDGARESINLFGSDTRSSMEQAKTALNAAQTKFNEVERDFQQGNRTRAELKAATDALATAHRNYGTQLNASRSQIQSTQAAVLAARQEWNSAKRALDEVAAAQRAGKDVGEQYVTAQVRLRDATVRLNNATAEQKRVARETGVEMNTYNAGIGAVKESLERKKTATTGATDATKALKDAVALARTELGQTWIAYEAGLVKIDAVRAASEKLKQAQEDLKPDVAAQKFLDAEKKKHDEAVKNWDWYETTYIPKYTKMIDDIIAQENSIAIKFGEVHDKIKTKATEQIVVDIKIADRFSADVAAAIGKAHDLGEAFKRAGIESTEAIHQKTQVALSDYDLISTAAQSSARNILIAEKNLTLAVIQEYKNAGEAIPIEHQKRLAEIEAQLTGSHARQKTAWGDFTSSIKSIGENLKNDLASAFIDLFEGKGWAGFKEAGLNALESIGQAVVKLAIDEIAGVLIKNLKEIVTDHIPGIKEAFAALGNFLLDIFGDVGRLVKNALGVGSSVAGAGAGAVTSGGGVAANAGGTVAAAGASGVASIVGAVAGVANAVIGVIGLVQQMGQSKSLGQIEENTRYIKGALLDSGDGGIISLLQTFLPNSKYINEYLQGTFNGAMIDLIELTREKLTNVFDEVKQLGDIKTGVVDMIEKMAQYFPELTTIRERAHDIATAIGQLLEEMRKITTNTGSVVTNLTSTIAPKLDTISTNVLNQDIAGKVTAAFQNTLQSALQPISSSLQSLATNVLTIDDNLATNATMTTGFSQLSGALGTYLGAGSGLSQGLSNLTSAMYNLPNSLSSTMASALAFRQTVTPVNVVVNVPASTSFAQQIRTQGVTF